MQGFHGSEQTSWAEILHPTHHPHIYAVGKSYVTRIIKNGERITKRYSSLKDALADYDNVRDAVPGPIHTLVRFTNTDDLSPDYLMRYVQLGVNKKPPFPKFDGANSRDPPRRFSTTVLLSTPCWTTAKLRRDEEVMKDYADGLSYNRGELIAAPGIYYVSRSKGYVRTFDGRSFRSKRGLERAKEHVNGLISILESKKSNE